MAKNPWLSFLREFRKKNPGLSLREAMKKGSSEYKSKKGSSKDAKPKKKGRKKKAAKK
jgi:hypothetical protein